MSNIPKLVHYCWFGNQDMPIDLKKYVSNWKYILKDYEIIEWNENNFDVYSLPFTSEAYDAKKWAFVSDYVRAYVLYNYGGIYLDADMEIIRSIDPLLENEAFCAFESGNYLGTAALGCKCNNPWIKDMLDVYIDKHFIKPDGSLDMTPNVRFFTSITEEKYNLKKNNSFQQLGDVTVYPSDYFYPKKFHSDTAEITDDTIGIHHWKASWCEQVKPTIRSKAINLMYKTFGDKFTSEMQKVYRKIKKID